MPIAIGEKKGNASEQAMAVSNANNSVTKKKKTSGCFSKLCKGIFCIFCFLVIISFLNKNVDGQKKKQSTTAAVTITATTTVSHTEPPTIELSSSSTEEIVAEPDEIVLKWPELGEYGVYYTFNENVKKATDSDKKTIIQCFVPSGVYTVTNIDCSPWTFVYVYSKETVISDSGWEEPAETWVSPMLKVGESCEVTIPEGWYINLQKNDNFKLVQK